MALKMSIVDLCFVRVMCGLVQWLWKRTLSPWSGGCSLLARVSVLQKGQLFMVLVTVLGGTFSCG